MKASFLLLASCGVIFCSCADLMKVPTIKPKTQKKAKFTDDEEAGPGAGLGGNPLAKINKPNEDSALGDTAPEEVGYLSGRVGEGVVAGGMLLPSDDKIVWSSGTDPNADIPFDKAFKNKPTRKKSWLESYREARRESMRSGKPILMWFTRSGSPSSPRCTTLNRELFAKNEFGDWAKENLIRLKVDASGGVDNKSRFEGEELSRRKYAEKLKKQYHVLGYPTLVILQPDGAVYASERGYSRGGHAELWGKLKNAALTIEHNREVYERKMAKKGYREWTGTNRGLVFAKLSRFDERSGKLWLTEPDGNVVRTSTKFISKDDRGWILEEKERRAR